MDVEQNQENHTEIKELDTVSASKIVIENALKVNGVLKGIAETIKALECKKVLMVFLAEDCDNEQYKETLCILAKENGVKVVEIPTWIELKDFCRLGLNSETVKEIAEQKGKEPKIKPRCSSAAIIDYGEDSEAKAYLEKN